MSTHNHAVLWIDHHEAHAVNFSASDANAKVVRAPDQPWHMHATAGSRSGTHLRGNDEFFGDVAAAVRDARAILLLGPSEAKGEFVTYLDKHHPQLRAKIADVRTAERMTDNQLVAEARQFFKAFDRLHPPADLTKGKGVGT